MILYRNLEKSGDIKSIWIWYRLYVVAISMYGAILLQYRFCIVTTTPQLIAKISWRYLHKRISYRHHFDVATMTMIFRKNSIFFTNIDFASSRQRHNLLQGYRDDIFTKEYRIGIISMLLLWRLYRNLKFSNDSISMLLRYRYDIVAMSFHYSSDMVWVPQRYLFLCYIITMSNLYRHASAHIIGLRNYGFNDRRNSFAISPSWISPSIFRFLPVI